MKTLITLAAVSGVAVVAANEPSVSISRDDATGEAVVVLERGEIQAGETILAVLLGQETVIVDGNCLAEQDGDEGIATGLSASISDDVVKLVGDADLTFVLATPLLTLDCGPFDDCLPCPQNLAQYKDPYEHARSEGVVEVPIPTDPEGCGGGDGPGGRLPAVCTALESPCAVACEAFSEL